MKDFKEEMVTYWGPQEKPNTAAHDLYHNKHAVEAPSQDQDLITKPMIMRQGLGGDIIDSLVGRLDVASVHSVDPFGIGGRAEDHAEKLEAWANTIRAVAEREQGEDTQRRTTFETLEYGFTGVKVLPLPQAWKGIFPKRSDDEDDDTFNGRQKDFNLTAPLPIAIWHIPARTWKPLLHGRKVIKSLEVKKVPAAWVRARYQAKSLADKKDTDEVELIEFVDDQWAGWFVSANTGSMEELKVWRHRMDVPVGQAPVVLIEGLTTADTAPGFRWKSMLADVEDTIKAQDFALSRQKTMVATFYTLTVMHQLKQAFSPDVLTAATRERKFQIGGTNFLLEGEEFDILGMPANLPDAEALFAKTQARLERHMPPVLQGIVEGVSSGYEFNLREIAAATKIDPLADNLAEGDADIMRLVFLALGALAKITGRDEKVYLRRRTDKGTEAIGLSWEDVKDYGPLLRAKREANLTIDMLAKLDAVQKAVELGFPWRFAVQEIGGYENPEELRDERLAENMENAPPLLQRTQQEILRRMDIIIDEEQAVSAEEAASMGPLPPGLAKMLGLPPEAVVPSSDLLSLPAGLQPPAAAAGANGGTAPPASSANPRRGQRSRPGGRRQRGGSQQARGAG